MPLAAAEREGLDPGVIAGDPVVQDEDLARGRGADRRFTPRGHCL
jgi:hypothetical protein